MKTKGRPPLSRQPEWLRRLPWRAKADIDQRRRSEEAKEVARVTRTKQTYQRYVIEAVLLFLVLEFVFFGLTPGRALFLFAPGVALGLACAAWKAEQIRYTLLSGIAYLLVYGLPSLGHFLVFIGLGAAIGVSHDLRRADGTEAL
ncbi:MAG: hypothetical protein ACREID_07270 [Planctomycetota bacterium]